VKYEGTVQPILNTIYEFKQILAGGDKQRLTVDFTRAVSERGYEELIAMPRVRLLGDIAHYYLRYVEEIIALAPEVRLICLKRDRTQTVESWLKKSRITRWPSKTIASYLSARITRERYYQSTNHWMEHDGSEFAPDPVWDKCFPKYDAPDMRTAIGMYYDDYYHRADALLARFPQHILMMPTETLNTPDGQSQLLDFVGFPQDERVSVDAHIHRSAAGV
jgi:hypothetical protein